MDEPRLREARADAEAVLRAGIAAADAGDLVREALGDAEPGALAPERTHAAAVGKAAPAMARVLAEAVPGAQGVCAAPAAVLDAEGVGSPPAGWEVADGGHPLPTEGSLEAGEALLGLARSVPEEGALLVGVSGGGSACAEAPRVPLADLRWVTGRLLEAGTPVAELNAARRPLSRLKGGGLAAACPGRVVGLVLSDVVGDDPADVASGPTVPTPPDPAAGRRVLEARGLWEEAPEAVREALAGARGTGPDPGDGSRVTNRVVGGNREAVEGAARAAGGLGYAVAVRDEPLRGEAREAGRDLARAGLEAAAGRDEPVALVAGGETTVTVTGHGRGGPCQELVLGAARELEGAPAAAGCVATDGVDGPTDAAGGVVDGGLAAAAREGGRSLEEALAANDAHRLLEEVGGLVRTGPTGTDVNDVAVVLVPGGDAGGGG